MHVYKSILMHICKCIHPTGFCICVLTCENIPLKDVFIYLDIKYENLPRPSESGGDHSSVFTSSGQIQIYSGSQIQPSIFYSLDFRTSIGDIQIG